MAKYLNLKVLVPEWIWERWTWVMYLIINWDIKQLAERIKVRPDERFYKVVDKHMRAYLEENKMPPDEIAPAILNLADDYMAGRPMNLRAGDYIAIQNYLRQSK